MKDCISVITQKYDLLTKSERKVADYMIAYLPTAIEQSILVVAQNAGVSEATVLRFCKNMGYEGFRSFCLGMAHMASDSDDYVMDIPNKGELEQEVSRVLMANAATIQQTCENMDYTALKKAAQMLISCRNIQFVGVGTSGIVCQDAMLRFLRMGRQASYYTDYHAAIVSISHLDERDVVVGISHSGTRSEVCSAMKLAKQQKVHTIGVTTYPRTEIAEYSDLLLATVTRESPLHKVAITSRISQLSVIDALFVACVLSDYDHSLDSVLEVSQNITNIGKV